MDCEWPSLYCPNWRHPSKNFPFWVGKLSILFLLEVYARSYNLREIKTSQRTLKNTAPGGHIRQLEYLFIAQSNELTEQLRAVKLKKERLLAVDGDNTIVQTRELMEILNDGPDFLDSFDAELFGELVETIIVESNERIRFRLKNGLELAETIERTVR